MAAVSLLCCCRIGMLLTCAVTPPEPAIPVKVEVVAPSAGYTLAEVREGVTAWRGRIRGLLVEHVTRGKDADGLLIPTHFHRTFAARGRSRFLDNAHSDVNFPIDLDIGRGYIYSDGHGWDDYRPHLRYCESTRLLGNSPATIKFRSEMVTESMGWWPPDDETSLPARKEGPFFLHEAMADPDCRLAPARELVDGAWCVVVERPGLDKLWLDPGLGFVLRRREWCRGRTDSMPIDYELSEYRQATPEVWIPWKLRRVIYAPSHESPGGGRAISSDATATLSRVVVNDFPDEVFRFRPEPGTRVRDLDTGDIRVLPGGFSMLDQVTTTAMRRLSIYERMGVLPARPAPWRVPAYLAAAVAVAVASATFLRRPAVAPTH